MTARALHPKRKKCCVRSFRFAFVLWETDLKHQVAGPPPPSVSPISIPVHSGACPVFSGSGSGPDGLGICNDGLPRLHATSSSLTGGVHSLLESAEATCRACSELKVLKVLKKCRTSFTFQTESAESSGC